MALENVTTELTNLADTGWAAYVGKSTDGSPDRFLSTQHLVYTSTNQTIAGEKTFSDNLQVDAQAHGGSNTKTFSASATFDADDGNNQQMEVTASTTIALTNELPGTYIITLEINTGTPPTITIGASLGTVMDNSADLINTDNDINIITILVRPDGAKYYTINTITV